MSNNDFINNHQPMTKSEFIQKFILTRVSHKRPIDTLLDEALKVWEFSHK